MKAVRSPPLNDLKAFEAAARHGSFALAGAELHVTAAAVSQRMKHLETQLGVALFERRPRGVALTEVGQRYRDQIARALELVERATESLQHTSIDGPLRLSLPQSLAQLWLIPRINRLCRRHPGLQLQVLGDNRVADLRGGDADLALRFGQGNYPGLRSELLMGDAVSLLMSSRRLENNRQADVARLVRESVLLTDSWVGPEEPWMTWTPWLRELGLTQRKPSQAMQFSDSGLAITAAESGTGICIGRMSLVLTGLQQRRLTPLMPFRSTEFGYYLVMREADRDNPRVQAFARWLRDEVQDHVAQVKALTGVALSGSR